MQNNTISPDNFGGSDVFAEDIVALAETFEKTNKDDRNTSKSKYKEQIEKFAETALVNMSQRSLHTFVFDDELMISNDYESINGYLIATDYLVDTFLKDKDMDNINFYANYNVLTKEINLTASYYTSVLGVETQKNVDIFLSLKEKLALIKELESYCLESTEQSCYQFVMNAQKERIDETVKSLYHLGSDNEIELYASYQDTAEFLHKTLYESRNDKDLSVIIMEQIDEAYSQERWQEEDTVLEKAGVLGTDFEEDCRWYFRDIYPVMSPFNHYLSQDIKVNIMLATPEEQKNDCCSIHEQYIALTNPEEITNPEEVLGKESALTWLLKQQGYSIDDLKTVFDDYAKFFNSSEAENMSYDAAFKKFTGTHNLFLTSVCEELVNHPYYQGVMTVLAEMSITDYIAMQEGDKKIVVSPRSTIGIFNPWNGSGSILDIQLEKPLTFSTDMIHDIQIEGVKPDYSYTVDQVYGLVGSCWIRPIAIEDIAPKEVDKGPSKAWEPPSHIDKNKSHLDELER